MRAVLQFIHLRCNKKACSIWIENRSNNFIAKHTLIKKDLIIIKIKIRWFPCDSSTPQGRSLVVSLGVAAAPKFLIKGVHQIFRYIAKNRFLRGQGAEQKIAQKHGQNVIFSFCTEEKVDKKWAKPSHLPGVFWFSRKGHFFTFFMIFSWFSCSQPTIGTLIEF